MDAKEKMLGVLGGMGPLASAQFMLRLTLLTPATRDQEHIPTVLWSDPRVPDRTVGKLSGGADPLPWLLRGIAGLQHAGCGAIAIPCNTAHGWFDEMQAAARVPILHIVDAAAADLHRMRIKPGMIGVMGTQATLTMRLYQDRLGALGWDCIVPSEQEMTRLSARRSRWSRPTALRMRTHRWPTSFAAWQREGLRAWCWDAPKSRWGFRPGLNRHCRWWTPLTHWHARRLGGRGDRSSSGPNLTLGTR